MAIDLVEVPVAPATPNERHWRAMGAAAHVIVEGGPEGLADRAVERIESLEAAWSRFRPSSDICRINAAAGTPVEVSIDTIDLVARAIEAWRITGGGFDPLLLGALQAAGYDRSFDELAAQASRRAHPAGSNRRLAASLSLVGCTDIEIDERRNTVTIPEGAGFDPGGIGKGLAADLVLAELMAAGADGACVNLGGDLRLAGRSGAGPSWTVAIDFPGRDEPIAMVGLSAGAVASSTTLIRRWTTGAGTAHHLLDPATGQPSESDLVFASVITADTWEAEVMAKAVLLRGSSRAFNLLIPGRHVALTVDRNGGVTTSDGFEDFVGGPVPRRLTLEPPAA
jgi:thiamine biosynthesis lipoprotein